MAKKQNFIVGSTNPNTNTWTTAELNNGWNKYQVLKSGDLDGVFNAVSDYSNDSSNEIANAIQALTGEQPTGASQSELGSALQKMREEIETSSLTFKGYVATSAPSSSTYSLVEGNIWINASAMPTTFPVAIAGVWNGTSWATTTDTYTVKDFDFFRNINNNEGYYWFGGQWTVMSTDMSTTYFSLNQTSGKWEIKSSVNLPGSPTTTTAPAGTSSTRIATTAFVANNFARLASPAFTGTPTAPTATAGTANTQIATTAFVATSLNGFAPLASPAFTGTPTAPTATAGTANTQIATTAFVANNFAKLASPDFTGTPTAPTPTSGSTDNQIATKKYVDEAIAPLPTNTYFPDLFDVKWADHICNDVQWLRADTFSWQSGAVYQAAYQHLVDDYTNANYIIAGNVTYFRYAAGDTGSVYCWKSQSDVTRFTTSETPAVGGLAYHSSDLPAAGDEITDVKLADTDTIEVPAIASIAFTSSSGRHVLNRDSTLDMTYQGTQYYGWRPVESSITGTYLTTSLFPKVGDVCWNYNNGSLYEGFVIQEAIVSTTTTTSITVDYYRAPDGHKICLPDQESALQTLFEGTGVAWYYIIDTTNQRFKLPRTKFGFTGIRSGVGKFVEAGLPNITGSFSTRDSGGTYNDGEAWNTKTGAFSGNTGTYNHVQASASGGWGPHNGVLSFDASRLSAIYGNSDTVQPKATEMYLYFYVGNFTQTALENTAGLNAELFNGKADLNLANVLANIDFVIERQEPTAANGYTWYRKYRSGWVEQGGRIPGNIGGTYNVSMPVEMADTNYNFIGTGYKDSDDNGFVAACIDTTSMTTAGFRVYTRYAHNGSTGTPSQGGQWQVSGMAAS